jgi:mannose-6-phosphate isomerase-like protein (cupin superfamily)
MEIIKKGWGCEKIIVNNEKYCGKILCFNKHKKCSFHYHLKKEETFYLQSGSIELIYGFSDEIKEAEKILLLPGDSFHIPIGLRHQMIASEYSELFEFSTQHFDEDSYRVIKGD